MIAQKGGEDIKQVVIRLSDDVHAKLKLKTVKENTSIQDVVERFIQKAGFKKNETYFKEMYLQDIEEKWKLDMSFISNKNTSTKRFDFVVKTDNCIYGIETNFYASGGSKLNETARSYKMIAEEADKVVGFEFVWFTDGMGWISARNNLRETFDSMDNIYNINDMKNGVMGEIFK